MKLIKTDVTQLVRTLKGDGLFTTKIEYKASEPNGEFDYIGPKIPPEMWRQILSFFKWSYDTTHGESQVRLFVSPKNGTWKAWAFPQQASCGMSTKELNTEDSKKQRADLFTDHDEWTAWGTVHHHCSMGAFQSGTDEADEKNVGGLHITIGDMDKPQHSMHARLYHQGDLYEPDMSKFWDIGNLISNLPLEVRACLQSNAADKIAREQMCMPSSVEFPAMWKENLIEIKTHAGGYGAAWAEKDGDYKWINQERYQRVNGVWVRAPWEHETTKWSPMGRRRGHVTEPLQPLEARMKTALDDLEDVFMALGVMAEQEIIEEIEHFIEEPTFLAIARVCKDHHLNPCDIMDEALERYKRAANEEVTGLKSNPDNTGAAGNGSETDYGAI